MFKNLKNKYYNWYASNYLHEDTFISLFDSFEKYGKVELSSKLETVMDSEDGMTVSINADETPVVIKNTNEDTKDIFYGNIHIQHKVTESDNILIVTLKKNADIWTFNRLKNKDIDTNSPVNVYLEIFMWYDIEVLGKKRCSNTIYTKGAWATYLFKTIEVIKNHSMDVFFSNEFSEDYK